MDNRNKIPQTIHLIWMGNELPEKYYETVLKWKKLNPEFEIILWTNMKGDRITSLENEQIAKVYDISSFKHLLSNYDLIVKELERPKPNYSAISDILRIDLIAAFGGYYFDIGVTPERPILEVIASRVVDFLCPLDRVNHYGEIKYIGGNDVYGGVPQQEVFTRAQHILREIDQMLETYKRSDLLDVDDSGVAYLTCRTRTGKAVAFALSTLENEKKEYADKMRSQEYTLKPHQIGKAKTDEKDISPESWKKGIAAEKELLNLINEKILKLNLTDVSTSKKEKTFLDLPLSLFDKFKNQINKKSKQANNANLPKKNSYHKPKK